MKIRTTIGFILTLSVMLIFGCSALDPVIEPYGPPLSVSNAPARLYLIGHENVIPNNGVLLRLVVIDGNSKGVDRNMVKAYDLAPGNHVLHYQLRDFSSASDKYCPTGMGGVAYCGAAGVVAPEHPYKLEVELKPEFVYVARPLSLDGVAGACLYGEPIGAPGQKAIEHSGIFLVSNSAVKVACGIPDLSVNVSGENR